MTEFVYVAISADGLRVRGRVCADDPQAAEQSLLDLGLMPVGLRRPHFSWLGIGAQSVPKQELIVFTQQLGYLLHAAVPLMDILADMQLTAAQDYPRLQAVIQDIHRQVQAGKSLSSALAAYPKIFDSVYLGIILAGEQSGHLDQALLSLHERLVWLVQMEQRFKKIMTYPLLVLSVILGVTAILMTQLVPQLLIFLQDSGKPIGLITQSLLVTSGWLSEYGLWLLVAILLLVILWQGLLRTQSAVRGWQDRMLLSLGIIGRVHYYLAVMRVTRVMALLYGAGLSLQQLLLISREAAGNLYLAERFALIEQEVMAGKSLARAFEITKAFPSMMIHLLRIGEQSGQLEQRLQDISLHYQREVERLLAQIEPWIEPMITLMLALLLGWIVMAVIMPVYDVIG